MSYVFDAESAAELTRLVELARMMNTVMRGTCDNVFIQKESKILDVATGPGNWAIDIAFEMKQAEVAGIDISERMIKYAIEQAKAQRVKNVSFEKMNILEGLNFNDQTFDFVNARLLLGVLKKTDWVPFFKECFRVLKKNGTLRLTEPREAAGKTNSPSYEKISQLLNLALYQNGYGFTINNSSPDHSTMFPELLKECGFSFIEQTAYVLDFSEHSKAWHDMIAQLRVSSVMAVPLLSTVESNINYINDLYAAAEIEFMQHGFVGSYVFISTVAYVS